MREPDVATVNRTLSITVQKQAREIVEADATIRHQLAQIERLRETREYWPHNAETDAVIRHLKSERDEQAAEIKRLRAALQKIVEVRSYRKAEAGELYEIARAALEGK